MTRCAIRRLGCLAVVASGLVLAPSAAPEPPDGSRTVVEQLHSQLLEVMRNADALRYSGRYARLSPTIEQSFDLPFMARKAAGRHWKALSEGDRERFVAIFSRLAVARYAGRFDGYDGERFETVGAEPAGHGTVLVRTRLVKSDGEPVQLDYRLRPVGSSWRIFDVFLDGTVSELALRRAEYSAVIGRDGLDALIRSLESQIAAEEQGTGS
jgi:phospholipid transport system substrate-binding protein